MSNIYQFTSVVLLIQLNKCMSDNQRLWRERVEMMEKMDLTIKQKDLVSFSIMCTDISVNKYNIYLQFLALELLLSARKFSREFILNFMRTSQEFSCFCNHKNIYKFYLLKNHKYNAIHSCSANKLC